MISDPQLQAPSYATEYHHSKCSQYDEKEADNLELAAVFIIYTGEFEAALLDSLKKICATK